MSEKTGLPAWATVLLTILVIAVVIEGYFIYQGRTKSPGAESGPTFPAPVRPSSRGQARTSPRSWISPFRGWSRHRRGPDPFAEIERLQEEINRMFEDSFGNFGPGRWDRPDNLLDFDYLSF